MTWKKTFGLAAVLVVVVVTISSVRYFLLARQTDQSPETMSAMNLMRIAGAKAEPTVTRSAVGGHIDTNALLPYLLGERMPVCGRGGRYAIGAIDEEPRCTVHGTFEDIRRAKRRELLRRTMCWWLPR